jgi:superoxide reductase
MNRRNFLLSTATVVAATTVVSLGGCVQFDKDSALSTNNIIFTQDNGGIWSDKKGSHLPKIEVIARKVTVRTNHSQSDEHYIVRHTVLLNDGTVVGATTFSPQDAPVSEYELPAGYKGVIYATSFCNKHDLWMSEVVI